MQKEALSLSLETEMKLLMPDDIKKGNTLASGSP